MNDKNAKYLRSFGLNQCVVCIKRDSMIKELGPRRSVRLLNLNGSTSAPNPPVAVASDRRSSRRLSTTNKTPARRSARRLSTMIGSPNVTVTPVLRHPVRRLSLGSKSKEPKSVLAKASRLRGRSKSVAFDVQRVDDDLTIEIGPQSPTHAATIDLTNEINQQPEIDDALQPRGEILIQVSTSSIATVPTETALSSGDKLAYENRIASLVESNKAKINRIKGLLEERAQHQKQVEDLHRINFSLAETVDLYRADENNAPSANDAKKENEQLKGENGALRGRVGRLMKENDALKSCLKTHSKQVLSEHNYNLL